MELWIPITLAAAFLQNLRSMLQKRARSDLSVNGASYTRFVFALPFVWLYLAWLACRAPLPEVNGVFLAWCLVAGVAQILATALLIASFTHGNFAAGTAFSKTDALQTALLGLLVLGDTLTGSALAGIVVSFFGVAVLSNPGRLGRLLQGYRGLVLGVLSGTGFAAASVGYRAAALSLPAGDFLTRAGYTLAVTVTMQTLIMGAYIAWREADELGRVFRSWRTSIWVGLLGAGASACWFSAMTLANAGLVRALGQVELLFTFAASIWFFRERVSAHELTGALLVVLGLWLLLT